MIEIVTTGTVVLGSGPAGAAVAAGLSRRGHDVLVIDGGTARERDQDRQLTEGGPARGVWGHEPLGLHRRRVLGGTSTAWGGRCIPLDPVDFAYREWIPDSGWPIDYEEFQSWFGEASALLEVPDTPFRQTVPDSLFASGPEIDGAPIEIWSPPTDFGDVLVALAQGSERVRIESGLHVTGLEVDADGDVTALRAVRDGEPVRIRGPRFVLATGALENARLLLASPLAERLPALGRYYMSHVFATHVHMVGPDLPAASGFFRIGRSYARHRWQLTEAAQRAHRVGNVIGFVARPPAHGLAVHLDAVSALVAAVKLLRRHLRDPRGLMGSRRELATYAKVLIRADASFWRHTIVQSVRRGGRYRLPMLLPSRSAPAHYLTVQAEHLPHRDSRVVLSDRVDRYGTPMLEADIDFEREDFRTVEVFHRSMADFLGPRGYRSAPEPQQATSTLAADMFLGFNSNAHHIGTTRMGDDPSTSVVDAHCRVHGVSNLYVAGASVFPTSGHANPTFTLVALACRLAARLAAS